MVIGVIICIQQPGRIKKCLESLCPYSLSISLSLSLSVSLLVVLTPNRDASSNSCPCPFLTLPLLTWGRGGLQAMGRFSWGGGGMRREKAGLVGTKQGTEGRCAKQMMAGWSPSAKRRCKATLRPNRRLAACLAQRTWLVESLDPTLLNVILSIGARKGQRAGHPSMRASLYAMTIHSKRKSTTSTACLGSYSPFNKIKVNKNISIVPNRIFASFLSFI